MEFITPIEVGRDLSERTRMLRLAAGMKQETLARKAGVGISSLRRFERHGDISLHNLLRLCSVMGRLDEFSKLLAPAPARSIAELERLIDQRMPKRGRQ